MNRIEKDINVMRCDITERISYVQSTNAIPLVFNIKDYDIPSGSTARAYVKRPDGTSEYDTASLSGNTVTVNVKKTMFSVVGNSRLQLRIAKGDEVLVSFEIIVEVRKNHADGGVKSENATDIFDEALKDLDEATKVAAVKAGEAAESARKADESYEKSKEIYENFSSSGDVTGVKGNSETEYRKGLVNITPKNIGLTGINDLLSKPQNITFTANTDIDITNGLQAIYDGMPDDSYDVSTIQVNQGNLWLSTGRWTVFSYRRNSAYGHQILTGYPGSHNMKLRSLINGTWTLKDVALSSDIVNRNTSSKFNATSDEELLNGLKNVYEAASNNSWDVFSFKVSNSSILEPATALYCLQFKEDNGFGMQLVFRYSVNFSNPFDKNYPVKLRINNNSTWSDFRSIVTSDALNNYKSLTNFEKIPSGADLKSAKYLVPGNYCCISNVTAETMLNCPVNEAFILTVEYACGSPYYIRQIFKPLHTKKIVVRTHRADNAWDSDRAYMSYEGTPPANKLWGTDANGNVGWIGPVEMDFGSYSPDTYNVHTAMKDILLNKVPKATRPRTILGAFSCGSSYSTVVQVSGVEGSCSAILFTYTGAAGMVVYQNKSGVVTYTSLIGSPVTIQ